MKIYILLGHTDRVTLSGALADCYEMNARAAGYEVGNRVARADPPAAQSAPPTAVPRPPRV